MTEKQAGSSKWPTVHLENEADVNPTSHNIMQAQLLNQNGLLYKYCNKTSLAAWKTWWCESQNNGI